MFKIIAKSLMFLSSAATVFFGYVIANVADKNGSGMLGVVFGVGIIITGLYMAYDLYRTFYRQGSK